MKFMLPCIAAVAIATFVGTKTLRSNASENNALLMENVEALSSGSDSGGIPIKHKCVGTKETCALDGPLIIIVGKREKV